MVEHSRSKCVVLLITVVLLNKDLYGFYPETICPSEVSPSSSMRQLTALKPQCSNIKKKKSAQACRWHGLFLQQVLGWLY
jgi:hypothetical protein